MEDTYQAVAFTRVASRNQNSETANLTRQELEIAELVQYFQLTIVKWFEQVGGKSSASKNTKLIEVFEYCKSNPDIRYLLVSHPDRLCRDLPCFRYWKRKFSSIGVRLVTSQTERLDIETPHEVFLQDIWVVVGNYQRHFRSEAVKRGHQYKKYQEENGSNLPTIN